MKIKKITAVALCLTMMATAFVFAGCDKVDKKDGSNSTTNSSEQTNGGGSEDAATVKQVELSFASEKYINDGDESLEKLIDGVDATIKTDKNDTVHQIEALITLLKTVPEGTEGAVTFVTDDIEIGDITVDGTKCNIDLKGNLSGLDLYTEQFFVYQIVDSVLDSFDDIKSISFTVDGKTVDTLGGHMDMSQAFTEKSIDEFEGDIE